MLDKTKHKKCISLNKLNKYIISLIMANFLKY